MGIRQLKQRIKESSTVKSAYDEAINEVYEQKHDGNEYNADLHRVKVAKAFAEVTIGEETHNDAVNEMAWSWYINELRKVDVERLGTTGAAATTGPDSPAPTGTNTAGNAMTDDGDGTDIEPVEPTKTTDDLFGDKPRETADEIIKRIRRAIEYQEDSPLQDDNSNLLNVVLYGKPGVGKSLLVEVVINALFDELDQEVPFYATGAGEMKNWKFGGSQDALRNLFKQADSHDGPAVVFIDEIDELASRDSDAHETSKAMLTSILRMTSGPASVDDVVVITATNRIRKLDEAMLNRGDMVTHVPNPGLDARKRLFIHECRAYASLSKDDLDTPEIEQQMDGMTGRDLAKAAKNAFHAAADRDENTNRTITIDAPMAKKGLKKRRQEVKKREQIGSVKSGLTQTAQPPQHSQNGQQPSTPTTNGQHSNHQPRSFQD